MLSIEKVALPDSALLQRYRELPGTVETYTDCFTVGIASTVTLQEFVFAFYTTPLFRLERVILKGFAKLPSTDEDARQLVEGSLDAFAAWTVEERTDDQLPASRRSWARRWVSSTAASRHTLPTKQAIRIQWPTQVQSR